MLLSNPLWSEIKNKGAFHMTINKSTTTQFFKLAQMPQNKAPFVRLCLMALTLVGGIVLTLFCLPPITEGLGDFLYDLLTGVVISIMMAGLVWGFARWARFI